MVTLVNRCLAPIALAAALALAGCTATAPAPAPSTTARATPVAVVSAHDEAVLAEARLASEQDDDDRALALLAPLTSPDAKTLEATVRQHRATLTTWKDDSTVSHLFFHSLIVDPSRAFDGDSDAAGYDDYMVTKTEFTRILASLYARGFVLISPHDLAARDDHGRMHHLPIRLPHGKKPIVLSQDDVNYYRYEQGDGLAKNLTIQDGRVVSTYVDAYGRTSYGADDVVPVVDGFVREHPDFAYHGHKGVIALTGYEGALGYRTSASTDASNPHRAADRAQATRVADAMKAEGWEFASHSWGHVDDTTLTAAAIGRDSARWDAEVRPITGSTDLYVYPFGADISGVAPYSGPKLQVLEQHGFHYFFGVDGSTPHWQQLGASWLRQSRIDVDGIRLRGGVSGRETVLDGFFDPRAVFDRARPKR